MMHPAGSEESLSLWTKKCASGSLLKLWGASPQKRRSARHNHFKEAFVRRHFKVMALVITILLGTSSSLYAHSKSSFHDDMRKLWVDHVTWTRLYIISAASGNPDVTLTTQRLLDNQRDIGNAVAEFYGKEAGDKLTTLLREHITLAADLVMQSKAGDATKAAVTKKRWYDNANEIAAFLHGANPKNWPLATLQSAMKMHLDETLDEATHRLQGKYDQDIKDYDAVVNHILKMADILSSGIIAQFPKKFAKA